MKDSPILTCEVCGLSVAATRCPNDGSELVSSLVEELAPPLQVAATIADRYIVQQTLAAGSHSRAYLATDPVTGRDVTIKLLATRALGGEDPGAELMQEARAVARLSSVHTTRLFDIGEDAAGHFLVYEHLRGRILESMLEIMRKRHRKLTAVAAAEMAAGVLRSLAEAHERDIVHGNVTPAHIALAHTGCGELTVKLLGFGSCARSPHDAPGQRARSLPAFMSPEAIQRKPIDGRSDLYALGVVLYRCVSGKLPLAHTDGYHLMQMVMQQEPERLELRGECGPQMSRFIHRLLDKRPSRRHRTALDALVTLQAMTGRRLHAVPHLAGLDSELEQGFGEHLVDASGSPSDFLDAKTSVYGISPMAAVGAPKEVDQEGQR